MNDRHGQLTREGTSPGGCHILIRLTLYISKCNGKRKQAFSAGGRNSVRTLPSVYCPDSVNPPVRCPLSSAASQGKQCSSLPLSLLHNKEVLAFTRPVVIPLFRRCSPPPINCDAVENNPAHVLTRSSAETPLIRKIDYSRQVACLF